jgi:hypothetical protein
MMLDWRVWLHVELENLIGDQRTNYDDCLCDVVSEYLHVNQMLEWREQVQSTYHYG